MPTLKNQCVTCAELDAICAGGGDVCNINVSGSGGNEGYSRTFTNSSSTPQLIKWGFEAFGVKDQFIVSGSIDPPVDTGCVSNFHEGYFVLAGLGTMTISVVGSCAGGGTAWNFSLRCITLPTSSVNYNERYGYDVCPIVLPPCGAGGEGESCAGRVVGPVELSFTSTIPEEIRNLGIVYPVAAVTYQADNFGFASGASGQVGCDGTNSCIQCFQSGVIEPFYDPATGKYYISAYAQNSPHGGPYGLTVSATLTFSFSPP